MPPTLRGGLAGPPVFHLVGHVFLCLHVRPCSFLPVSDTQRQKRTYHPDGTSGRGPRTSQSQLLCSSGRTMSVARCLGEGGFKYHTLWKLGQEGGCVFCPTSSSPCCTFSWEA